MRGLSRIANPVGASRDTDTPLVVVSVLPGAIQVTERAADLKWSMTV